MSPTPDDLGPPASYLTLEEGAAVVSRDGERIGKVEEVVADTQADVFDGLVIGKGPLGLDRRYVDADHVYRIHARGVAPQGQVRLDAPFQRGGISGKNSCGRRDCQSP